MHANTGALSELFSSGKAGTPVITQLAGGELLLAKDNIGIFIGSDGKPSRKVLTQPNILVYVPWNACHGIVYQLDYICLI